MIEGRFLLCHDLVELVHAHTNKHLPRKLQWILRIKYGVNVAILMDKLYNGGDVDWEMSLESTFTKL